ncbi:hypothetical protein Tco_1360209 [Tanacetum coccineum]
MGPTFTHVVDEATTIGVRVGTEGATTTTSGLNAGLDSGNVHKSPFRSHEAPLHEGHTSGSAEDNLKLKKLMVLIPKLVTRIANLEKELHQTKTTYGKAVLTLVERGSKIQDIDDDPLVSLVRESMKEKDYRICKDFNTSNEDFNTGSLGVSTGSGPVSTPMKTDERTTRHGVSAGSKDIFKETKGPLKRSIDNRHEEIYDRVLWGDLKTMFDPPLSDDAIWSLPLQQKMINWSDWLRPEQMATGKVISKPLTAIVAKIYKVIMLLVSAMKH